MHIYEKQIFFLHSVGAQGPHEGSSDFVAWLEEALGPDFEIIHSQMPNLEDPDYVLWKVSCKVSDTYFGANAEILLQGLQEVFYSRRWFLQDEKQAWDYHDVN